MLVAVGSFFAVIAVVWLVRVSRRRSEFNRNRIMRNHVRQMNAGVE